MDRKLAEARLGRMVDRYRLEAVLGAGGSGAVFRARHLMMQRDVALKLLHGGFGQSEEVHGRFLREARTLARIDHPHVVAVHDCGIAGGEAYLAMELLDGEDLARRLRREGRIPLDEALCIAEGILGGLEAAHAEGIVHRDLKPANIFLARRGDEESPKLVDFGVSKVQDERLTRTGMILGTPVYMAPEAVLDGAASVDGRADLYAVGVVLFEMLSGRLPYDAPSYQSLIVKVATEPPAPLASVAPGVPPELSAFVDRAVAWRREDRFPDARSMREALTRLREAASLGAPASAVIAGRASVAAAPPPTPSGRRLRLGLLVAMSGSMLALGAAAFYALAEGLRDDEGSTGATTAPAAPRETSPAPPIPASAPAPVLAATKPTEAVTEAAPSDETSLSFAEGSMEREESSASGSTGPASSAVVFSALRADGVSVRSFAVVGRAAAEDLFRLVESAQEGLERCRGDRDERVHVHLHLHDGRIALAGPNPSLESTDVQKARCVAEALRKQGPLPEGQGIVQLSFELAAR